ncbi:MAG: hypothetical protein AB7F59_04480 [Bdellovibrionales bacterium]
MKLTVFGLLVTFLFTQGAHAQSRFADAKIGVGSLEKTNVVSDGQTTTAAFALPEAISIERSADTKGLLPKVVSQCESIGAQKIVEQAKAYGVIVDMNTFRISGYSKNILSEYVWFSADVIGGSEQSRPDVFPQGQKPVLQKVTQKSVGYDCF